MMDEVWRHAVLLRNVLLQPARSLRVSDDLLDFFLAEFLEATFLLAAAEGAVDEPQLPEFFLLQSLCIMVGLRPLVTFPRSWDLFYEELCCFLAGESLRPLLNVYSQPRQALGPGLQFILCQAISIERQWLVSLRVLVWVEDRSPLLGQSVILESFDGLHFFDDVGPEGVFSVKAVCVAFNRHQPRPVEVFVVFEQLLRVDLDLLALSV